MKKTTTWKIDWPMDDKGLKWKEVYVTSEATAKIVCTWPLGYCGFAGRYEKHTIYEAENFEDAKKLLKMKTV